MRSASWVRKATSRTSGMKIGSNTIPIAWRQSSSFTRRRVWVSSSVAMNVLADASSIVSRCLMWVTSCASTAASSSSSRPSISPRVATTTMWLARTPQANALSAGVSITAA